MMKSSSRTALMLGIVIGMALASTAFAQNGGVGNGNGNGNGKHGGGTPPAAPEPGLLLMAVSGVALCGGYIVWRRKQSKQTSAT